MGRWPEKLQEVIDDFSEALDQMERYEMLFELAEDIDELDHSEWTNKTRVVGCQSEAHIDIAFGGDGFHLRGSSDSQIIQGLMAVTAIALEGLTPEEVTGFSPNFASEMKVLETLTPNRANGFLNMFLRIQDEAREQLG
jgi:cysteine desulfuration protein SufE